MSYSLRIKCGDCTKKDKCVDRNIISGAISGIHEIGSEKGHLGGGSIEINCSNLEVPAVEAPAEDSGVKEPT